MIYYLDTSVIVAALTREDSTPATLSWFDQQRDADLLISEWVRTEVSSALSIKLRTGQIDLQQRARAMSEFSQLCIDSFTTLAVTTENFRAAARFADQHGLGLRASDALHLAIASDHGATLCTRDRRLIDASAALAIPSVAP